MPDAQLTLRRAQSFDGEALQSYFRGLSAQSRYNRVLAAASELPPGELARTLAANGRDRMSWLLTWTFEGREIVVGEARMALSCPERAAEFSMSVADGWRRLGVGAALLEEIEAIAAAEGVELVVGDVLRTNGAMLGLARSCGFRFAMGLEPRLLRIEKQLEDAASDPPCRKWVEVSDSAYEAVGAY